MSEPHVVTITEIVEKYGVARKTVQRWVNAGKLKPVLTLPGKTGTHLFTPEAAEAAFGSHVPRGTKPAAVGDVDGDQ